VIDSQLSCFTAEISLIRIRHWKWGLVDEIQQNENLEERAVERIIEIANHLQPGFAAIKSNRLEAVRLRYEKNNRSKNEKFLNCWFSRPVQKRLAIAAEKF